MAKPENPVQMAVIGAAHGIKGEVRVKTFTGDPLALGDYGKLYDRGGRVFEVKDIRPANTVVVVRFKGIADRNAAEALAGVELFIDRSALPATDDEEEFYHADLMGLAVRDDKNETIGKVLAIQNFGGGDLLEVATGARNSLLIPFTTAAVPEISIANGYVRVDPAAAGLIDDGEGPPEEDRSEGRRKGLRRMPDDGGDK